jgi:hypothetical protein
MTSSKCAHAVKLKGSTGLDHWCEFCDRDFLGKVQSRHKRLAFVKEEKKTGGTVNSYTYTYTVQHAVYCYSAEKWICGTCFLEKPVSGFTNSQLRKPTKWFLEGPFWFLEEKFYELTKKCRDCQKTCPFKLKEIENKAAKKKDRETAAMNRLTVAEKLNQPKEYFLKLPIDMLVSCLWLIMSSPPPAEGPHLLAYQADPTADPIWVPMCGRYSDHQQTIEEATRLVLVPADMCPTQIRLNKFVKKVDMSLLFLLLIVGSIAKLSLKVFTTRKFSSGQDNSVNVHSEQCGCGIKVLSNKALPYCPSCICRIFCEVTGASEPPKYDTMTNSVVDWARDAILEFYSPDQITHAIKAVVTSSFWKDTVEFSMNYEIEVRKMMTEKMSTMCSICGGPCGVYFTPETTADTVTIKFLAPLPWQPSDKKSIFSREENNDPYYRPTGALFGLQLDMTPSSFFDFNGAASKQIENAEKAMQLTKENLKAFKTC